MLELFMVTLMATRHEVTRWNSVWCDFQVKLTLFDYAYKAIPRTLQFGIDQLGFLQNRFLIVDLSNKNGCWAVCNGPGIFMIAAEDC